MSKSASMLLVSAALLFALPVQASPVTVTVAPDAAVEGEARQADAEKLQKALEEAMEKAGVAAKLAGERGAEAAQALAQALASSGLSEEITREVAEALEEAAKEAAGAAAEAAGAAKAMKTVVIRKAAGMSCETTGETTICMSSSATADDGQNPAASDAQAGAPLTREQALKVRDALAKALADIDAALAPAP